MENKGTGWKWVIIALILFWPVGLFMLIRKLTTDKSALMSNKIGLLLGIGWFLVVGGFFGFVAELSSTRDSYGLMIATILAVGGILLLCKASKTKKTAARYKKYIDIIVNHNVRSIDNIASAVGLSYNVASKDLQDMIRNGYLKDAYIAQDKRKICLKYQQEASVQDTPEEQAATRVQTIRCPGCGANNAVVAGKTSECEYCGTPIQAG